MLAGQSPDPRAALDGAKEQGLPHLILDSKVVASDRRKEETTMLQSLFHLMW